ncbi:lactonase family protein [Streptomyces sp. NPDC012888]|uniref:lactonase family protein n=1 Tax=Streptomyces sp. NPDC012888 TaxID=3364855 RepID=UPI00367BAAB0
MTHTRELRVRIGSFTSAGGRGITTAAVDGHTGELTVLGHTDVLADPSYLAAAPDGSVVYAVSEGERGLAMAFRPDPRGLVPLGAPVETGGAGPTHLAVAGRLLLTAHYTSGGIGALPLGPDGAPHAPAAVLAHHGSGPDPDRQRGPHAHQVLPDPSGRWVLAVDLGTDSVRVCAAPAPDGAAPVPHGETALRPGSGPRHLAFHPAGGLLYVLHELRPQLTVCRWDGEAGEVRPAREVPAPAEGATGAVRAYPSAVAVSPDGRFLWAAVRGTDTIAAYSLADPAAPALAGTVACGGRWPRDLVLDPSGRRLYAANERSGDVTWFDVDPATGVPRRAGSVPVPAATCVLFA